MEKIRKIAMDGRVSERRFQLSKQTRFLAVLIFALIFVTVGMWGVAHPAALSNAIIIDFGSPYGLWVLYDDGSWQQLHTVSPESVTWWEKRLIVN